MSITSILSSVYISTSAISKTVFDKLLISLIFTLALSACGGSGGGASSPGPTELQGVFLDSAVAGLEYSSGSLTGTTGADGTFLYTQGATITFTVGDIVIGTASAQAVLTPISLVPGATDETNPTVTNIVRFLMTIDDDGNSANGIQITAAVSAAATGQNLDFTLSTSAFDQDANVVNVIATLTSVAASGTTTLVSEQVAQTQLNETLVSTIAGIYNGTFSGSSSGTWSIVVNTNGFITGSGCDTTSQTGFAIDGTVLSSGVSALGFASDGSYAGNFSLTGEFSGTWSANNGFDTGTFTGSKADSSSGGSCSSSGPTGTSGTYTVVLTGSIGGFSFPDEVYATNFSAGGVPSSGNIAGAEQFFVSSWSFTGTISDLVVTFVTETESLVIVNYSATITPTGFPTGIAYDLTYTY